MRRSIQGAVALLSVLVVAGCSAPAPEPTPSATAPSLEPAPSPAPQAADWQLPSDCEAAVTPSVQRQLDSGAEQLEPLAFDDFAALVPDGITGIACTNFIPNSDGLSNWAVARVPVEQREEALDIAADAGFEVRTDVELDGIRFITLVMPDRYEGEELQSYGATTMIIGDAWLHMYGATAFATELLREMAATYGLPIDVSWAVPLSCDDHAAAWPELTADGRTGEWSGRAGNASSFGALAGVVGVDAVLLECAWSTSAAPSTTVTADRFTMVGRLTAESRVDVLEWLEGNGWRITDERDGRADAVRDGETPGAGIITEDGLVLVEPLDAPDAGLVEPFASQLGMLG